jgi:hypothetical protein
VTKRPRKVGKNPDVPTEFLPDRERAKVEEELRNQLKKVSAAWRCVWVRF